jgi:voltage-gated potassium channel
MSGKTRIHDILEGARHSDRTADLVQTFILALIILNVGAMIFESVRAVYLERPLLFYWIEVVSVAIFSVEYVLRLWSCTAVSKYHGRFTGRLKFAVTPLALVDIFAILPFYLPLHWDQSALSSSDTVVPFLSVGKARSLFRGFANPWAGSN